MMKDSRMRSLRELEMQSAGEKGLYGSLHFFVVVVSISSMFLLFQFWLSMFGAFVLTVLSVVAPPPSSLPHLWPVLVSLYSCAHFALFLIYYLWQQLLVDEHPHTQHHPHHHKQEHIKGKSRTFSNKHRKKNQ